MLLGSWHGLKKTYLISIQPMKNGCDFLYS